MSSSSDKTVNALDLSTELTGEQLLIVADPKNGRMYQATVAKLKTFLDVVSGANGKSAYQVAVDNGFLGTEIEWLASLKGQPGEDVVLPEVEPQAVAYKKNILISYDVNVKKYRIPAITGDCTILIEDIFPNQDGTLELNIKGDGRAFKIVIPGTLVNREELPKGVDISYTIQFLKTEEGNFIYNL